MSKKNGQQNSLLPSHPTPQTQSLRASGNKMPLLIADRLVAGPHVDSTALHLTGSLLLKDYSSCMVAFRIYGAKCIPHTRGLLLPFFVPECVFGVHSKNARRREEQDACFRVEGHFSTSVLWIPVK